MRRGGLVTLGILWLGAASAHCAHFVTVTAGNTPAWNVPARVAVPAEIGSKPVVLANGDGPVASQPDSIDGKPAIAWIIPKLEPGQTLRYTISEGESPAPDPKVGVSLKTIPDGLEIRVDDEPFTTYVNDSKKAPKPHFYPVIGPTGKPVTRTAPIDHIHHSSFWFTHGSVNGIDFWSVSPRAGKTVHQKFQEQSAGPVFGEFVSVVDWMTKAGERLFADTRRVRIYRVRDARLLDFEIVFRAEKEAIVFGDTKEGAFAFRVASSMQVDQARNKPKGTLTNSNGDKDGKAWGKRATWCDYTGPVEGETVGIAIFDNPRNFRHPTYWHARTYGLFAVNPFGVRDFTGDKKQDGTHRVEPGKELRLNYRVYIHKGDATAAKVADYFAAYADPPRITVD